MGCAANKHSSPKNVKSKEVQPVDSAILLLSSNKKTKSQRVDSALGCIYGGLIGNALGVKGNTNSLDVGQGNGLSSRDSDLAMYLLNGLSETLPIFSSEQIAMNYKKRIELNPSGISQTCMNSLEKLIHQDPPLAPLALEAAKVLNEESKNNSSILRSYPLALWAWRLSPENTIKLIQREAAFTNTNQIVIQAETYYIIAMAHLIKHPKDKKGALLAANIFLQNCNEEVKKWVEDSKSEYYTFGNCSKDSIRIGFVHCFRKLRKEEKIDFETCMNELVNVLKEKENIAGIVGALIGTFVGFDALPENWKRWVDEDLRKIQVFGLDDVKKIVTKVFNEAPCEFEEFS